MPDRRFADRPALIAAFAEAVWPNVEEQVAACLETPDWSPEAKDEAAACLLFQAGMDWALDENAKGEGWSIAAVVMDMPATAILAEFRAWCDTVEKVLPV